MNGISLEGGVQVLERWLAESRKPWQDKKRKSLGDWWVVIFRRPDVPRARCGAAGP